ncbi:MAG: AlbA family DNA-binding domain-containing protein [Tsuneonella suprasediminis]
MLNHPIDAIDEIILQALVDNHVAERRDLEFKRELPGRNDEQVKEFLADVTSLANAQGGDLIYGIEEDNGVAAALPGVEINDPDAVILRLESSLQANVAPRLTGVRTHWVSLANGRGAMVMRIPGSLTAPHRVIYKKSGRFYGRNSRGKYEMDVHELRLAFTQSEQLP